jgi:hypothetical protein
MNDSPPEKELDSDMTKSRGITVLASDKPD